MLELKYLSLLLCLSVFSALAGLGAHCGTVAVQ